RGPYNSGSRQRRRTLSLQESAMNRVTVGLVLGLFLVALAGCNKSTTTTAAAAAGVNKEKLVGTWETSDGSGTLEFTKDGKVKTVAEMAGVKADTEGTYEVDGDKVTITPKGGDKEKKTVFKIKKLDDKELTTVE